MIYTADVVERLEKIIENAKKFYAGNFHYRLFESCLTEKIGAAK